MALAAPLAVAAEGSPYEDGRPHAPDRSRHIALKKPCHLPVKVTLADGMGADVKEAPAVLLWVGLATLVASFLVLDHKS